MPPGDMDAVFEALAHPDRRRILDIVKKYPGCCVNAVAAHFPTSRIAVMKHLKALQKVGLLISRRDGRFRRLYFNVVPIQMIYDRWTSEYSRLWAGTLTRVKYKVETQKGRSRHGRD